MDTILRQLYDGELCPGEQFLPLAEEYREMQKKHYEHYEDFIKELQKLEPSLHDKFIKIMDEQFDTLPYDFSKMFIDGFRLGARMMVEVFEDKCKTGTED